jgi:hypothetical protein
MGRGFMVSLSVSVSVSVPVSVFLLARLGAILLLPPPLGTVISDLGRHCVRRQVA